MDCSFFILPETPKQLFAFAPGFAVKVNIPVIIWLYINNHVILLCNFKVNKNICTDKFLHQCLKKVL
jgi:hypothetical protein